MGYSGVRTFADLFVSAVVVLCSLSLESNRHVLVEAGAVSVFVQLLDSGDEDVQFYSAAALSNLAVHGEGWKWSVERVGGVWEEEIQSLSFPFRELPRCYCVVWWWESSSQPHQPHEARKGQGKGSSIVKTSAIVVKGYV